MTSSILRGNLERVRTAIAEAAESAGRSADDVKLIAVTKYVDADTARALADAGQRVLGESRPQVLWEKAAELSSDKIEWHLIGHLQRNKVKRSIEHCDWIHSVDSLRLLNAIERASAESAAEEPNRNVRCLLEVNVSGEQAKHGFQPDQLESVLEQTAEIGHIQIAGLMAMASRDSSESAIRTQFAKLRELREKFGRWPTEAVKLTELSMGMSGDFEAAIAEGSTMVRIGSKLFEGI